MIYRLLYKVVGKLCVKHFPLRDGQRCSWWYSKLSDIEFWLRYKI
jgi:hypothetical protein